MKAHVDRDLCIGCGDCEDVCPDVFRVEEDGISRVIVDVVAPELWECVRDAAEGCPTEAISFTTADTEE